ncbi:MAG: hypothetical protein ABEI80_08715 [Haloplanus sp.]
MVGTTLVEIREHIESLASDDGEYYLACARTGERPVPAVGARFEGRTAARNAARAVEQYRATLRQYDPRFPYYDVIVRQDSGDPSADGMTNDPPAEAEPWSLSEPVLDAAMHRPARRDLVEFCHRVAAAVFETLSDADHDAVETAVMDAYFDLAETVSDPDTLCLCLLESMTTELEGRLTPAEQAAVVAGAGARLQSREPSEHPVSATLDALQDCGLIGEYLRSPWSVDLDAGTRSTAVRISDYALSPTHGRLPVLPLVLDLHRRRLDHPPSALRATETEDGWRVTLVLSNDGDPDGLVSAPIRPDP